MTTDKGTAMMAMLLSETMNYADALHMPEDKLMKELEEITDYSLEHPIHIIEPRKWVRLNALARAAKDRGIFKTDIHIPTCTEQIRMQERSDNKRKNKV